MKQTQYRWTFITDTLTFRLSAGWKMQIRAALIFLNNPKATNKQFCPHLDNAKPNPGTCRS